MEMVAKAEALRYGLRYNAFLHTLFGCGPFIFIFFLFCFPFFFTPSISQKNDDHTSQTPSVETLERITRELRLLSLPLFFTVPRPCAVCVYTYRSDGYSGGNLQFSTCRRTDNTRRIVSLSLILYRVHCRKYFEPFSV